MYTPGYMFHIGGSGGMITAKLMDKRTSPVGNHTSDFQTVLASELASVNSRDKRMDTDTLQIKVKINDVLLII